MTEVRRQLGRIVKADILSARERAAAILADAEAKAEAMRRQAQSDVATWRAAAEREGRERAHAEMASELARAKAARDAALEDFRGEAVGLVCSATERLLRSALVEDPERIAHIVEALLSRVAAAERCVVRVHPHDADVVRNMSREHQRFAFDLEPDDSLEPGECIVDSSVGRVDARFAVQLDALRRALTEASSA